MAKWIWIDIETTGLNPEMNSIVELAAVVTDENLAILGAWNVVICPGGIAFWNEWARDQHSKSGLTVECESKGIPRNEAERACLTWLRTLCEPGESPLCGSSPHFDRAFLKKYMPDLEAFFHYRNIDVSTLRTLAKAWGNDVPKLRNEHRAMPDIVDSIREMEFYRREFIRNV